MARHDTTPRKSESPAHTVGTSVADRRTFDVRELARRMQQGFAAARAELDLGEQLLLMLQEDASVSAASAGPREGTASPQDVASGVSVFNRREMREIDAALRAWRSDCLEGIADPAMRELAQEVNHQSTTAILWSLMFMRRFGELARSFSAGRASSDDGDG